MQVEINQVADGDLAALVAALGQRRYFADRLARQRAGTGQLIVARVRGQPVGDVFVWTGPADEPEIRAELPDAALLNHLEVQPPYQNRGVGTALVAAAEEQLRGAGRESVALLVETSNVRAEALYRRLGYRGWPAGLVRARCEQELADGSVNRFLATCRVLVKPLG